MLTQPDLILRFQDSWLVRSIADCEEKALTDFRIVEVKDALDMQTFINGFSQAYFEIEKTQLDHYCHALLNAYHDKQAKLVYFYILDNYHNLVGVSAIAMIEPYSFSYCIGVIPAFRGKKISTLLLDHHSQYAKKEGCNFQVLQTEANSFVENIYMKNNFTLFETMRFYQYNPHP
jgi:GNAT superfamily N-acetyltransferase